MERDILSGVALEAAPSRHLPATQVECEMWIAFKRLAYFAAFWLVLTGGDTSGWAAGAITSVVACLMSLQLLPLGARTVKITGAIGLLPGFLLRSLIGGIDVAWRAMHPHMPLNPGWVLYPLHLPPGPPRVALGSEVSLMPGTLAAGSIDGRLYVHCLVRGQPVEAMLAIAERRIAGSLLWAERNDE